MVSSAPPDDRVCRRNGKTRLQLDSGELRWKRCLHLDGMEYEQGHNSGKKHLYWDADTVRLKEVHFFPTENANTDNQRFDAGSNHYVNTIPSDLIPTYMENGEPSLRVEPYLGTYFYRFNTRKKPLNDVRIRQALTMAINQRAIVRRITKGGQFPATGYTPPGISGYKAPELVKYNPRGRSEFACRSGIPEAKDSPNSPLSIIPPRLTAT